jgi:hypothetical protein
VFLPTRAASQIAGFDRCDFEAAVFSFDVSMAGRVFYAAFIHGIFQTSITSVGAEAMTRACGAAQPSARRVILPNSNPATAANRTLRAMLLSMGTCFSFFAAVASLIFMWVMPC